MHAAVLSDYEDAESVREAFDSAFSATSFEPRVAVEAVRLVCVGGTFAPAATLLSQSDRRPATSREPLIEDFIQRQSRDS